MALYWHRRIALVHIFAAMIFVSQVVAVEVEIEQNDMSEPAKLQRELEPLELAADDCTVVAATQVDGSNTAHSGARESFADLEDHISSREESRWRKRKRKNSGQSLLTPLELQRSRGRSFVYVTEICSQVMQKSCCDACDQPLHTTYASALNDIARPYFAKG